MVARTIRPLERASILSTANYLDLNGLEQSGLPTSDPLYEALQQAFGYAKDRGKEVIVAYWPDGIYGLIPVCNIGVAAAPALVVNPDSLVEVYQQRFNHICGALGGQDYEH